MPLVAAIRGIGRGRRGLTRLGLTATLGLAATHLWLLLATWRDSGLSPASNGRHAGFVGLAGFHGVVAAILLVMLAVAVIWCWARPDDGRGHATAWNAGLVYLFAVFSAMIVLIALYLVPRLG
jgi:heme/copper-type cytochrome/quinol oxidase subunit 3